MSTNAKDTAATIAEARELDRTATPGPWVQIAGKVRGYLSNVETPEEWIQAGSDSNAAFIARARTLLPALADALEAAQPAAEPTPLDAMKRTIALIKIGAAPPPCAVLVPPELLGAMLDMAERLHAFRAFVAAFDAWRTLSGNEGDDEHAHALRRAREALEKP